VISSFTNASTSERIVNNEAGIASERATSTQVSLCNNIHRIHLLNLLPRLSATLLTRPFIHAVKEDLACFAA